MLYSDGGLPMAATKDWSLGRTDAAVGASIMPAGEAIAQAGAEEGSGPTRWSIFSSAAVGQISFCRRGRAA